MNVSLYFVLVINLLVKFMIPNKCVTGKILVFKKQYNIYLMSCTTTHYRLGTEQRKKYSSCSLHQ